MTNDSLALQPLTLAALSPLLLSYHVQAVLAILPNTFIFKLLLLPYILWQVWKCIVEFDHAALFAQLLGHHRTDRVAFCSFVHVVRYFAKLISSRWMFAEVGRTQIALFCIGLRACEWTFVKRPLRRYEPPKRSQDTPIERRLSAFTVFVDTFDLLCSTRGIGWSWSSEPFPLPLHEPPKRRQYFRPEPYLRASHRFGCILRHLWRHVGVRVGRLCVSRIDISRANRLPPAWPRVAACLSTTVDVHLDSGVLEFPLAPVCATRFHRVWSSSRRETLREARRAHGRICSIRLPSPSRLVGGRKWDGIRHCWGVLLTHGRRGGHGGSFCEDDGAEGPRMAWVGMDDGVDDCVWYVHDRWVGSIWSTRYRTAPER